MADNPWLGIPAADYEAHMADPSVRQSAYLSAAFARALDLHRPRTLAVLGCATGNGFEHLGPRRPADQVVGIDLNHEYLSITRARHADRIGGLLLVRADVGRAELAPGRFDLVHAALLFEYVDHAALIPRIARWLAPGGALTAVFERPTPGRAAVTPTAFASLGRLDPILRPVDQDALVVLADKHRLSLHAAALTRLASGKEFVEATFRRRG